MPSNIILFSLIAYLLGSIPFGKIVGKQHSIDIQKHGSGNIGFANVVRVLGWKAGAVVLLGDVSKGLVPVLIAQSHLSSYQILAVGLAAIAGHIFPVWLKFKGGKGIATGLGVTLALSPAMGAAGLAIYLLCFACFKMSAPSSLAASWSLPLMSLVLMREYVWFYLGLAILATWAHRDNVRELKRAVIRADS